MNLLHKTVIMDEIATYVKNSAGRLYAYCMYLLGRER